MTPLHDICPRCGREAEVRETIRAVRAESIPWLPESGISPDLRLVEGRIKLVCPECGTVSDLAWGTWLECDGVEDPKVDALRKMYLDEARARWDRMRRGEPDPGPSNCDYIKFEGMTY